MLIANAASIINRPLDGRKSSHPSSSHKMRTLSRTGRLPFAEARTSGTPPPRPLPWEVEGSLAWVVQGPGGMSCAGEMGIDNNIKLPRHQLLGLGKGPKYLSLGKWPFLKVTVKASDPLLLCA